MTGARVWRHFDFILLAVTILLTLYGVVMIYSATHTSPDPRLQPLWRRQAVFGAIGVGVVFLLAAFPRDYQWLGDFWWLAYLIAAALLVLVLFFGQSEIGNVSSWFRLGSLNVQPSFVAMILLTIAAGAVLSRRRRKRGSTANPPLFGAPKTSIAETVAERPDFVSYLVSAGMTLSLTALVFRQPDLATAAVLVAMWLAMLFESDIPARYLALTALVGLGAIYPIWKLIEVLKFGYVHERILAFLNPASSDTAYQLRQATIAIGSGGMWGQGLGHGTQSQLRYLPVRHTDFVFAVTAEEMGFLGVMLLFALYLMLFWRLLRAILVAPDAFGRLLATGVLAMILFQFFVNVGMNLGLLPVAGLPLPFISYGPAALLTTMAGIGIVENVVMRHKRLEF